MIGIIRTRRVLMVCLVTTVLLGCGRSSPPPMQGNQPNPAVERPGKELPHPSQGSPDLKLVPADAIGFATLRVADLWNSDPVKQLRSQLPRELLKPVDEMEKMTGLTPADIERATLVVLGPPPEHAAPLILVVTAKPYDNAKIRSAIAPNSTEQKDKGLSFYPLPNAPGQALHFAGERLIVVGPVPDIQRVTKLGNDPPKLTGYLNGALTRAAQPHVLVAGFDPALPLKQAPVDQVPPEFRPLLDMKFATLVIDLGADLNASLQLHFEDKPQAAAAENSAKKGLTMAKDFIAHAPGVGNDPELKDMHNKMVSSLDAITVKQEGPSIEIAWKQGGVSTMTTALLLPAVAKVREAANRTQSVNNLKQIALAMHIYHDTMNALPGPAIYSKDGKPLLSWRVAILPYIEQDPLYKQFKLDEPWDSPTNKKLLNQMPKIYSTPSVVTKEPNVTFYRCFTGKGTLFEGPKGMSFAGVKDGLSNTIMVVEATDAVPWTKPDDLVYDPQGKLPALGKISPAVFLAAFGDGSVRAISRTIQDSTLRALITANGNETINDPNFR